ncbi:MAG: ATP phosphoribosyltransferase regulatory subunit [Oscillospiraceae bacterium]|nr:ATP phosphoribosyltransferase regulatory subunit [Oscillospiraceae bacterium]
MKRRIEDRLEELSRKLGYAPYKMSRFEEYELYVRNKDFLQSDRVITFSGRDGRLLAMKPDVTLSIVKNAPETPGAVRKVHYRENVYRMDRDTGNFREILQAGIECVGDVGFYEVAEVVYLAARSLEALGEGTILSLSHVGLIRHALEKSGLPASARVQALDCLRRKREQELRALCQTHGADEKLPVALLRARELSDLEAIMEPDSEAWQELRQIIGLLPAERVRLDFSLGNDMKYYSGLVFKGYVRGVPNSVLSGGQYDRLLSHMGKNARAIGFAVYLDQLERLEEADEWDVDTLLLCPDAAPAEILAAAESLPGTVLAVKTEPERRSWKRKAMLEEGEVRYLD